MSFPKWGISKEGLGNPPVRISDNFRVSLCQTTWHLQTIVTDIAQWHAENNYLNEFTAFSEFLFEMILQIFEIS